jgi:hypothetical protein
MRFLIAAFGSMRCFPRPVAANVIGDHSISEDVAMYSGCAAGMPCTRVGGR